MSEQMELARAYALVADDLQSIQNGCDDATLNADIIELLRELGHITGDERADVFGARAMGRRGGLKGGPARARSLSPERRSEIASVAAKARWGK